MKLLATISSLFLKKASIGKSMMSQSMLWLLAIKNAMLSNRRLSPMLSYFLVSLSLSPILLTVFHFQISSNSSAVSSFYMVSLSLSNTPLSSQPRKRSVSFVFCKNEVYQQIQSCSLVSLDGLLAASFKVLAHFLDLRFNELVEFIKH